MHKDRFNQQNKKGKGKKKIKSASDFFFLLVSKIDDFPKKNHKHDKTFYCRPIRFQHPNRQEKKQCSQSTNQKSINQSEISATEQWR